MNDVTNTAPVADAAKPAKKPAAKKAAAKKAADAAKARAAKVSAVKKGAKPKKSKEPKVAKLGSHLLTAKLAFAKDGDGKPYSLKNSPKREGSKSAKMWLKYSLPGTIQKQLDNGVRRSTILWDIKHGYVAVAK